MLFIIIGYDAVDQAVAVLCGTNMLVGAVIAFILDNTIPGLKYLMKFLDFWLLLNRVITYYMYLLIGGWMLQP